MHTQKTFREVSETWCETKRPIIKHSTMCAYILTLRRHLLPCFGEKTAITEADVQRFVVGKLSDGLAVKTVRDMVSVLKSVVKYGKKHGIFPFEDWETEYPVCVEKRRLPALSMKHQRILMRHLVENPTAQNIGVLLALCTGMRIGEVCALQWQDVDLCQRIITVRHTVSRVYNCELKETEVILSSPKTKSSYREVPVSGLLYRCLKSVRKTSAHPYVVGASERAREPRAYRDYFSRLLKRLDIPRIVFHGLRHTFATRCMESRCDYKTVSAILGHSDVATTLNLYVHPDIGQKQKCVERMNRSLGIAADPRPGPPADCAAAGPERVSGPRASCGRRRSR